MDKNLETGAIHPDLSTGTVWVPSRGMTPLGTTNEIQNVPPQGPPKPEETPSVPLSGTPKVLFAIYATESPVKKQNQTRSEVAVSYVRDPGDKLFSGVHIWFKGYHGIAGPQLMADGSNSPVIFDVETTGETVVVIAQAVSANGSPADFNSSPHTTVKLDGVVSAPPPPVISQSLTGTPMGYQFAFNQLPKFADDIIDSYRVYRGTTSDASTAECLQVYKQSPNTSGVIVVNDTITAALGLFYFYFVSAVNTSQLESVRFPAQSGPVVGCTGSIPPSFTDEFSYTTSTDAGTGLSTIVYSWKASKAIYRADGTITPLTAGTLTINNLLPAQTYSFYPYFDEAGQALTWLSSSEMTFPDVTGTNFLGTAALSFLIANTSTAMPASFTVELWAKTTQAATLMGLMQHDTFSIGIDATGAVIVGIWNGAAPTLCKAAAGVVDGAWHHIVFTYDGLNVGTLYVDNVTTAGWQNVAMGAMTITTAPWLVGWCALTSSFSPAAGLTGTISRAAVYNTVQMSPTTIASHFQAGVNLGFARYDAIVALSTPTNYWKLDEASGTVATDSGSAAINATYHTVTLNQTSPIVIPAGSPAYAWPFATFLLAQAQVLRNRVPLSNGSLSVTTPAIGAPASGGSNGRSGRGGCFSPDTLVKTTRGDVRFDELDPHDWVFTAQGTWRPIVLLLRHKWINPLCKMPNGWLVTPQHQVLQDSKWVAASEVYPLVIFEDWCWVHNLEVATDEEPGLSYSPYTEHSYTLADGTVVHNMWSENK